MVDTANQKELEALARFYQGEGCINPKGEIVASPSYLQQYKGISEEQILFEYLREKRGGVREMAFRDNDRAPEPKPSEQPQKTSLLKKFAEKRYESFQPADKTNDSRSDMSESNTSSISNRQLVDVTSSNIRQIKKEPETVSEMNFDDNDSLYSNKEKLILNDSDLSGKQNLTDRIVNKPTTVTPVIREARRNEDRDAEDGEEFKKDIAGNVSQVDKAFGERSNFGFSVAKPSSQVVSDKQEINVAKERREQVGSRGHKEELNSSMKSSNSRKVDQDDEDRYLKGTGVTKEYGQQKNSSEFNFTSSGQISKGSMTNEYEDSQRNESYHSDNNLLKKKNRIEEEVRLVESVAISKPYVQSVVQKKDPVKEEIVIESQVLIKNLPKREEEDRGNISPSPSLVTRVSGLEKDDTRSVRAAQSETSIADTVEKKSTKGDPPNIPSMFKSIEEMLMKILKRQDILEKNQQQIMNTQEEQDKHLKYIFGSLGGDISQLE